MNAPTAIETPSGGSLTRLVMPLGFSLEEYAMRADSEKASVLRDQWSEAVECGSIHCTCGLQRALPLAYRCLYCGQYFCGPCAEKHFGQTLQEWIVARRIEKRRELEQRHNEKDQRQPPGEAAACNNDSQKPKP